MIDEVERGEAELEVLIISDLECLLSAQVGIEVRRSMQIREPVGSVL